MVALALSGAGADTDGSASSVTVQRPGGVDVGDQAAEFTATTIDGSAVSVPQSKPTVLFFMAAWCAPVQEASALDRIERDLGGKVVVLSVDVDPSESVSDLKTFAEGIGARYDYVHDVTGELTAAYGVQAVDSTVVIDAAGRIVYRDTTSTDEATLRGALSEATSAGGAS
jgi:peroxiredoxin